MGTKQFTASTIKDSKRHDVLRDSNKPITYFAGGFRRMIDVERRLGRTNLCACIDYQNDLFIFHSTDPETGELRSLMPDIRYALAPQFPTNYWPRRIRQLAISLPRDGLIAELDISVFPQLSDLETIFIVAGHECHCEGWFEEPDARGFVALDP